MSSTTMELLHFVKGLDPVADAFAGTVVSDVVNMSGYGTCIFTIVKGVGATGTSTVTVLACDDVVPTNSAAVPFMYRAITTGDTEGALTAAAAAGFATTAGSSQRYIIEVDDLALAASGYKYVQLKMVELVDDPVLGGIEIMMTHARFAQAVKATAIV